MNQNYSFTRFLYFNFTFFLYVNNYDIKEMSFWQSEKDSINNFLYGIEYINGNIKQLMFFKKFQQKMIFFPFNGNYLADSS